MTEKVGAHSQGKQHSGTTRKTTDGRKKNTDHVFPPRALPPLDFLSSFLPLSFPPSIHLIGIFEADKAPGPSLNSSHGILVPIRLSSQRDMCANGRNAILQTTALCFHLIFVFFCRQLSYTHPPLHQNSDVLHSLTFVRWEVRTCRFFLGFLFIRALHARRQPLEELTAV